MNRKRPRPARAVRVHPATELGRARMRSNLAGEDTAQRWYTISNDAATSVAEVLLYDEIGYWGTTAQDFIHDLDGVKDSRIDLHLNSPGGEVFEAVAIYNALRRHPKPVTVYIDGVAASAASFIAMAGDTIHIERNAQMMVHDAISVAIGNAAELIAVASLLDKTSDNIADIYAQRAGGTVAQWRETMRATTWYTAEEAVAAGLADQVREYAPRTTDHAFAKLAHRLCETPSRWQDLTRNLLWQDLTRNLLGD